MPSFKATFRVCNKDLLPSANPAWRSCKIGFDAEKFGLSIAEKPVTYFVNYVVIMFKREAILIGIIAIKHTLSSSKSPFIEEFADVLKILKFFSVKARDCHWNLL